jgi:CrcB protein
MTMSIPQRMDPIERRFFSGQPGVKVMFSHWLLVALGGAAGAVLRFYISETLPSEAFPWATLSVNLVGSFLLGIVMAASLANVLGEAEALLLGVGVLGAFTTMSTFSVETMMLMEDGHWRTAGIYVLTSAVVGPLLAWFGWKSGQAWFG